MNQHLLSLDECICGWYTCRDRNHVSFEALPPRKLSEPPSAAAACPKHHRTQFNCTIERNQHHRLLRSHRRHRARHVNMLFVLELLFAFILPLVAALKFDIQAHPGHESASKERCVRNFVAKDQLVVVTATVSGNRGDGQTLNMHVSEKDCELENGRSTRQEWGWKGAESCVDP